MADERTQNPSQKRRQEAQQRGLVARSPELSAAVGLLVAVVLWGVWGDDLAASLIAIVRALVEATAMAPGPSDVVARLRWLAWEVALPCGAIGIGFVVAALAAHQIQVGGLWAPGLLAPEPTRLWSAGGSAGFGARAGRGAWGLIKTTAVAAVTAWILHADWPILERFSQLEPPALARAAAHLIGDLGLMLALATLALGLLDFAIQYQRIEALLRTTPEQHREDLRALEGDPGLRAQRRRIARMWRSDSPAALAGASLVLTGPAGLCVVLAGGPPPRPVSVRSVAQGPGGWALHRSAKLSKIPQVDAPGLARRLARRQPLTLPLPATVLAELAAFWPAASRRSY